MSTALQRQKAAQAKLVELETAAKAAAEAVEEAKQKAIKRQEDIDPLQADFDQELAILVRSSDSVTHLQVRDAFQALSGCVEAQPLLSQMESAFTGPVRHAGGRNAHSGGRRRIDPAFRHHRQFALAWATGIWGGTPDLDIMQAALRGSVARLGHLKRPWCGATDTAATFVLTLLRLGWSAQSARLLTTHDGTNIDLLAVAPKMVGLWVDQASLMSSDSSAHWNHSKGPLFWEAVGSLLVSGKLEVWSLWHRNVLVKLVSRGIWTQERLSRLRGSDEDHCQPCHEGPGTMFHHCCECPSLQTEQDMQVSQEVRQAAHFFSWAFSPVLPQYCQQVHSSGHAQFCGATGTQTAYWRVHMFTDGSSSGTCALQRMGLCRATCCWRRPRAMARTTPLPWQATSPRTLSRCTSTAKVPSRPSMGQRAKPWGRGSPSTRLEQGFWFPTTRSGQSRSRTTPHSATWRLGALPTCSKGETTMPTPLPRKGQTDTHKPAFRVAKTVVACPWPSQAARWAAEAHVAQFQGLGRHQGCRAKSTDTATASAAQAKAGEGDCCAGCAGLRSGVRLDFSPSFLHASRKTVISTHARSEGTACSWEEFSILGVVRWTVPSSSAPSVEQCTGNVRTRCAAAAAKFLAGEPRSCTN